MTFSQIILFSFLTVIAVIVLSGYLVKIYRRKKEHDSVPGPQVSKINIELKGDIFELDKLAIILEDLVRYQVPVKTILDLNIILEEIYTSIVNHQEEGQPDKKVHIVLTVEPGQIVQPGQSLLMLVPLEEVWVTANFKETQLRDVRPGQEAEIEVDMNGRVIKGRVDSIAGSTGSKLSLFPPENAAGNYVKVVQRVPVKIVLDAKEAADAGLRPGLSVTATIHTH